MSIGSVFEHNTYSCMLYQRSNVGINERGYRSYNVVYIIIKAETHWYRGPQTDSLNFMPNMTDSTFA